MTEALRGLVAETILALGPVIDAAQDPQALVELLADLGWTPKSAPRPLLALAAAGSDLAGMIGADESDVSTAQALDAIARLIAAVDGIRTEPDTAFPTGIDIASFKATIERDLLDYLVVEHLLRNRHRLGGVLRLAGFIRLVETPADGLRRAHLRREVMWSAIGDLLTDPAKGFREAFDWDSAAPGLADALGTLATLLESYGLELTYFQPTGALLAFANAGAVPPLDGSLAVDLAFDEALNAPAGFAAGVLLVLRPPTPVRGQAVSLLPYASLNGAQDVPLGDAIALSLRGDADFTKGVAFTLAPGHPVEVLAGFLGGAAVAPGEVELGLKFTHPAGEPERLLIGVPDASRVSIQSATFSAGARLVSTEKLDAFVGLDLDNAHVVIKPARGEADSFLAGFLGDGGISVRLPAGLRLSSLTGFHLVGSSGLEAVYPVDVHLGPVDVRAMSIALRPGGNGVALEVGATIAGSIGPVAVAIERAGFRLTFASPDPPTGNLGPLDVDFGFLPPDGAGLAIDAQVVVGGGFLRFDPRNGEYSGVLQLQIADTIAVNAVGLLSTRLPDGGRGYSLLVIITAEGFDPVPLPMGFRLTGIGGLLAINRTFAEDVLRAGLKSHTLDSVMFPQDPLRNAPEILSNLNRVFPAALDHYLFGPMVQIEWGAPTLLTAQVAVVLEFGARLRLLVLAQIAAILPKPEHDLIHLQMDAIGVVDFDQGTAAIDASLYDSRLLQKFVLTGDMALRLKWTAPPAFALAVGGLHPAFNPPPGFPKLARIAINLAAGDNPRIRCEAYFALTGSSIQFGARAELYAAAAGFSIQGEIGFDVLIQRDPFAFLAEFLAQVQLKRGSSNLFKVRVEGALAGPRPLHVTAKATFEILGWDASVRVDRTLVGGETPPSPAPVDVLPILLQALRLAASWSARLPAGQRQCVTLRPRPELAGEVLLHPLGPLVVSQTVVPLNLDIARFGDAVPAGARRFTVRRVTPSGQVEIPDAVPDFFAPAQFFEMSDDEKLSRPSFESLPAGVRLGAEGFAFSASPIEWLEVPAIQFETIIIGQPEPPDGPPPLYSLPAVLLAKQACFGAAANSDLRRTGTAKYRTATEGKHRVAKEGWSIVAQDDLAVQTAPGVADRPASYSEAEQALARLKHADPTKAGNLKILRLSEVRG